jgi:hypothetical protein
MTLAIAPPASAQLSWCERIEAGPDEVLGTADDRLDCRQGQDGGQSTDCYETVTDEWVFGGPECSDCLRTLFLPVQCPGTVSFGFSGNQHEIRVDAITGGVATPLPLILRNTCTVELEAGAEYPYCDGCGTPEGRLASKRYESTVLEKPADSCVSALYGPLPELPCLPVRDEGFSVRIGRPLDAAAPDTDGSGFLEADEMDGLPCSICREPECDCGSETRRNRAELEQATYVEVANVPAPTVLRLTITSGDTLFLAASSCTDPFGPDYSLMYGNQADAEALLDPTPAPRLELDPDPGLGYALVSALGCPGSARVRVTTCNRGNAAADIAPFRLIDQDGGGGSVFDGDQTAHPTDPACQTPILPGECRTCEWDVPLSPGRLPETELELVLDPDDLLAECDEASSPETCAPHLRHATIQPCRQPACGAVASAVADREELCLGESLNADASATTSGTCAGTMLFTFETEGGDPIPGGAAGPSAVRVLTPDATGDIGLRVHAECDVDPTCRSSTDLLPLSVGPGVALDFPSALSVTAEGECALRIDWDAPVAGEGSFTYELYRADSLPVPLDAAHLIAAGLADTSFLDAGWNGVVAYRVVAVADCDREPNGGGDSALTMPLDSTPPTFGGITDTRDLGFCEVEVLWDETTAMDACSGVASYNIYRDNGVGHAGETLVASGVPGSPHVDTTPGNGTWVYVVRAVDAAGNEEGNEVFQQESENSCTNDFPRDAGMDRENGVDPPNADGGAPPPARPGDEEIVVSGFRRLEGVGDMSIRWTASPDEGGLYLVTYSVLRGSLDSLRRGAYDHALATADSCGITGHQALLSDQPTGSHYYLVAAVAGDNATFGYDSSGQERVSAGVCYLP